MPDLDAMAQMAPLSFADVEIPYQSIHIEGGGDDHEHKYPHSAGAANEKLGRKLYQITVKASFQNCFTLDSLADVYPGRLQLLLFHFDRQDTAELKLPNRAPIQAYCTNWSTDLDVRVRSGEAVELKFKEDRNEELANEQGISLQRAALRDQNQTLEREAEGLPEQGIFDSITDATNSVLAYIDQGQLYGNLLAAKIEDLTRLIKHTDETLDLLNDPERFSALAALLALWETLLDIKEDLFDGGSGVRQYVTPMQCSITELVAVIPDCGSTGEELMALNYFPDPLAIPANTTVMYYGA